MSEKKITSQELAAQIADNPNISKENAETILKLLLEGIESSLKHGKPVKIENLGTFQLEWTDAAESDDKQGDESQSKGSYRIVFTPDVAAKSSEKKEKVTPVKTAEATPDDTSETISAEEEVFFQRVKSRSPGAFRFKKEWGLFLLFMVIPVVTLFYFLNTDFRNGFNSLILGVSSEENLKIPAENALQVNEIQAFIDSLRADSIMKEEEYKRILTNIRKYEDILTEVVVDDNVTLEWLSKKYYNNEIFWVYIYDANKEHLTGFRRVKPGTELLIPRIPAELLDTADLQSSVVAFKLMDILLNNKEMESVAQVNDSPSEVDKPIAKAEKTPEPAVTKKVPEKVEPANPSKTKTSPAKSEPAQKSTSKAVPPQADPAKTTSEKRKYDKILAEETLDMGERLTYYADIYYGHRDFWVYIYEANRNVIANPQSIAVGTKVIIPDLNPDLIDLKNPESLKRAKVLHDKYLK